ncbi:MAG TPA: NUDIX hydrolase [Pyrinomonadaceae bacterium]|nr:NUDIX hydrolase [Pyrinomonadaceae bacterium]
MSEERDTQMQRGATNENYREEEHIASSPLPSPVASESIGPWERVGSENVADCRVFKVRRDWSINPRDGRKHDFYCIEAPDWINIVPLTARDEVVMIEQYRHGTDEVTLEIPGGMVDPGESPLEAAAREMLEETGYMGSAVEFLGKTRPNPAIQNNWIHTFLARNVSFRKAPEFESAEHTVVRLVPLADVPALISNGTINHALVVVGFHWLSLKTVPSPKSQVSSSKQDFSLGT